LFAQSSRILISKFTYNLTGLTKLGILCSISKRSILRGAARLTWQC